MKKNILLIAVVAMGVSALAQSNSRDAFLKNQAYNEMMRVVRQMEVLESNFSSLSERVSKIEKGGETSALKAEIEALKAEVNRLKADMQSQRKEIVADIAKKINAVQARNASAATTTRPAVDTSNCEQYVVQSGDTLSLISQAFGTTVRKLKELNNLKSDNLRVGQKLLVPVSSRR